MVTQVTTSYMYIVYGVLGGIGMMIVYLLIVRFLVGIIVWGTLAAIVGGCGYGSYVFLN